MNTHSPILIPYASIDRTRIDTIIDTRSPAEYAEDHIPGAINCPVLDDEERAQIGTLYKQVSPFVARKHGAILTARNIARAIETHFLDHPKTWTPLIYCWRGGQRSAAMQIILREIGWNALRLEGGYKAYRTHVLSELDRRPSEFSYVVIGGPTGSAKTKLLHHLRQAGAQTIDLEEIARHKGSVLGGQPNAQPQNRKMFDTLLVEHLRMFTPSRPVFIEAESRRIGIIHLPQTLVKKIHDAQMVLVTPPKAARLDHLANDYHHFINDPVSLCRQLNTLRPLHAKERITQWLDWAKNGSWSALIEDLLDHHYDPLYQRSLNRDFIRVDTAVILTPKDLSAMSLNEMAAFLIERFDKKTSAATA